MIKKFFLPIVAALSITLYGSENPSGIDNKDNTCYMNAAIQCLYNIQPLTDFLLAQKNTSFYLEEIKVGKTQETIKTVAFEYIKLIDQLKNNQSSSVDPITFCPRMWRALKSRPGVQGDADEFINVILEKLIDSDIRRTPETQYYGFPFNYIPKGMPGDLLYGLESTVLLDKRVNVNRLLMRRENALYTKLAISIIEPKKTESSVSLESCLNNYFATTDSEKKYISKKLEIMKLPSYMIITLKRFSGDDYQPIEKIATLVTLPINSLDMKPYVAPDTPDTHTTYELISVVQHGGGTEGGHYNAYIKYNNQWFLCNDSHTSKIDTIELLETVGTIDGFTPYVLFYRKINPDTSANFTQIISEATLIETLSDMGVSEQMLNAYLRYKKTTLQSLVDGINQKFITIHQLKGYIIDEEKNLKKFYPMIDVITLLGLENQLNILGEIHRLIVN